MNSSNLSNTQHLFSDLSLKPKANSLTSKVTVTYDTNICKKSPEIYDLVRFQHAIMSKYVETQDVHFKNMANALTPQIEEKIRAFKKLK